MPVAKRVAALDLDAALLELGLRRGEGIGVGDREAGGDHPGASFGEGQAVTPCVGAQVRHAGVVVDHLEADDLAGEPDRAGEILDTGTHVGDVGQGDHGLLLSS